MAHEPEAPARASLGVESEEFASEPVPAQRQVGWIKVALVSAMVAFSLPTFVTGAEIFLATDNTSALQATLVGSGLLALIAALCGSIGSLTHLSSYMLARVAFGSRGAALVNLAFALSLLGWFGVNIDLFSGAVIRLLEDSAGLQVDAWVVELFAGAAMTITTIYGFRAINTLSMWLVPVMMTVTVVLLSAALDIRSWTETLNVAQSADLTFGDAVSSVVGGVIIGAIILPDITRFIRHWRGAVYTAMLSFLLVQSVVMIAGGFAADSLVNEDFLDTLLVLGLGWGAFVTIIAGSWVLNSLNLYSSMLSVQVTLPALRERLIIVALGTLGTAAAFFNILDYFLTFLFYLAVIFVPVAGVIAVDYFLVRRSAYHEHLQSAQRLLSVPALIAWAAGAVIALIGSQSIITLSSIAALDAMLVAAGGYWLLSRFSASQSTSARR